MEISGDYTFNAPRRIVWDAVQDPDVLGTILPGGEGIEEVGENQYTGNLKIKVGPVQGKFKGDIELSNIVEMESYDIKVDGKGAPGFVKANGDLKLSDQGEQTYMVYAGKAQVGGRIASIGQRLVETSAKSIIRQSLEALNAYVVAQYAAQAPQTETAETAKTGTETDAPVTAETADAVAQTAPPKAAVPEYKPPSQTKLALTVVKDVIADLIQSILNIFRGKK